ncbi:hypothetical protein CR513_50543, partial [Mucuna pruriens]
WCTVLHWCLSRSRRSRSKTGKSKSVKGDRLGFPTHSESVRLCCINPHLAESSREVSTEIISSQSLLKASQPVPRRLSTNISASSSNIFAKPGQMENNDRTLKELVTPDVVYQPLCIQYPQLEPAQTYELKRRPPQAFERIPCGLFHNETVGDSKRLY